MSGWIKLHRKFCEWEWFKVSEMVHLFIYILLNANHENGKWRGIEIKRGQLLTGRKTLHEKTGISEQTIRTCLKKLEKTKELTINSTNQFSIITVCNYESYQENEYTTNQQTNQQLTSDQPATNQQLTTNKKNKKEDNKKNDKNIIMPFVSENFLLNWEKWKKYKSDEHRFKYKSEISENSALHELDILSEHNEISAINIIEQSIKNGWKGFFKMKIETVKTKISTQQDLSTMNYSIKP